MVYIVVHDLSKKWTYIEIHKIIESWNIYKTMIYLKDGLHTSPLMDLNVEQYTEPSQNKKSVR